MSLRRALSTLLVSVLLGTIPSLALAQTFTITASAGLNGAIAPSGAVIVNQGADQEFTITPDAGFHVLDVLVDGGSIGAVTEHTFTNVQADHTIDVSFAINTFTITASAGSNGVIAPSGAVVVNQGADQSFTITPNTGYHVLDVLVDGGSIGAVTSHTFTNVQADHTIDATFAINTYTITASAGPNGSIAPSGAVVVNHGANQLFTMTPASGWFVTNVVVDGVSQGAIPSYTFNNVTANHTIAASFAFTAHRSTAIAISPDGLEGWVVNPDHGSVSVFGTQGGNANTLLAEVPVGAEPWCVDTHPTNGEVWVTSLREDKIYIVDAASRSVITTIPCGFETFGVAFNPTGTTALVTATGADKVYAVDVATRAITNTMSTYRRPRGIAWRNDGQRAWVSHLLMPESIGKLTTVFPATWTTSQISIAQSLDATFTNAGYPSTMQNITVAPAPADTILYIPNNMINTTAGQLIGFPLNPTKIMHAIIRPVNVRTSVDLWPQTYFMSNSGTPVGGPIAVDFKGNRAYVASLHSESVTVLNINNILAPVQTNLNNTGKAPIGIVTHPTIDRAYVANWLSRNITVLNTATNTVVTTFSSTSSLEPLPAQVLHGKQLFYSSKGPLSQDGRVACASCHVFDRHDARPWDLSQFGKHLRATPDARGIGFTGAHDWTSDKDEMQDHNAGIIEFAGGAGLIPSPNPPLGPPNAGLSQDMDDMAFYMATLVPRRGSPHRNPDGTQTAEADSGEVIFNNPTVGCATCHVPPFYTDSTLENPFVKHIVGTADPADADAAPGFDTPSLVNLWDSSPYLHNNFGQVFGADPAGSLLKVINDFNPNDQHGVTSTLTTQQKNHLVAFLLQITWPETTGGSVDAPTVPAASAGKSTFDGIFPNPFRDETSLRFSLERSPSSVRIDVFDVSGRRVRTLLDRVMTRGTHIVGWDARDDAGRLAAPGVYFAKLVVDNREQQAKRLTLLY